MKARVGDRLRVHGRTVGHADHSVEIVEVRGTDVYVDVTTTLNGVTPQ